jgi:hypothetical protein
MAYPQSEQETIVIYDVERRGWHIDTTYPPHVRKYREFVGEIEEDSDDRLAGWLSEDFSYSFTGRKKKVLTDEEKQQIANRFKSARQD